MSNLSIDVILWFIKALVTVYDVCTFPVYALLQRPWSNWKKTTQRFGVRLDQNDPESPYVKAKSFRVDRFPDIGTMDELTRAAVQKYSDRPCLGTRAVLKESEEQKDGKVLKKLSLGDYEWLTFSEVDRIVDLIGRGIMTLGLKPREYLGILAETRQEWTLTALACFRVNVPIVTLYATLGEDGIIQALNDTEVTHLVTSYDLMPRICNILCKTPSLTRVIYMESQTKKELAVFPEKVELIPFSELEKRGKAADAALKEETPTRDDVVLIMYTSGTTSIPKGVMVTHRNILATLKGLSVNCQSLGIFCNDAYIAYLPLAHILELLIECLCIGLGVKVGFSSALTLTDKSTGLLPGCPGDATLLKPTVLVCPPLILDRIRKSITEIAVEKGPFFARFFEYVLAYKCFWLRLGFNTPILNRLVFSKMRALLGGRFYMIATGAAPLSVDTDAFIRACLDCCPVQGYGLTETAGSAALKDMDDRNFERIGSPIFGCYVKLVDWEEGNYRTTDQPHPRGEIVVGGDCVTLGYYNNEALTREHYKEDGGMRWFYTGDIGQMYPDGTFSVIDRKKDLVKLQHGEYVALGKVETELKTCPLIDNICVCGNSYRTYLVALVTPNPKQLETVALQEGKSNMSFSELCKSPAITRAVANAIAAHGHRAGLHKTEIPVKVKLCAEDWQPDTGLVTAAFKLRRREIQMFYQREIDEMYGLN
ncbi:unnamed protein product [Ixodes hexagonus]